MTLRSLLVNVVLAGTPSAGAGAPDACVGLPASYEGVLPCADCPAIRHYLDLLPAAGGLRRRVERKQVERSHDIGFYRV